MSAQRKALLLFAAALSVAASTGAGAQRISNRPTGNFESVHPVPPRGGGDYGGYRGGAGFGVMVPGIILAPQPGASRTGKLIASTGVVTLPSVTETI